MSIRLTFTNQKKSFNDFMKEDYPKIENDVTRMGAFNIYWDMEHIEFLYLMTKLDFNPLMTYKTYDIIAGADLVVEDMRDNNCYKIMDQALSKSFGSIYTEGIIDLLFKLRSSDEITKVREEFLNKYNFDILDKYKYYNLNKNDRDLKETFSEYMRGDYYIIADEDDNLGTHTMMWNDLHIEDCYKLLEEKNKDIISRITVNGEDVLIIKDHKANKIIKAKVHDLI